MTISRIRLLAWLVVFSLCGALGAAQSGQKPFYEARNNRSEFNGPGREVPDPLGLASIKLGYFGPSDPQDPVNGDLWRAAGLALEELNAAGGYHGIPYELVPGWSENRWGSGVTQVTRMVFQDQVWAVIGSVDGAATHLAEQVVAKAFVSLINPGSTDKTINLANVPWMFSCLPGEHLQAPVLTEALRRRIGDRGAFGLVTGTDHDSRILSSVLRRYWSEHGLSPRIHYEIDSQEIGFDLLAQWPEGLNAAVVLADPRQSRRIVSALRERTAVPIFGSAAFGRSAFVGDVPSGLQELYFPYPADFADHGFNRRFSDRFGHPPDFAARQTYDALLFVAVALQHSGLNRARLRDALRDSAPWEGVAGVLDWDNLGQNRRPVRMATYRAGALTPWPGPR